MRNDLDQTIYLLGLVSGLQAITNDINSGGSVNVPKDIAGIVERSMTCLDNTKFWGAPNATRAVIWTLLPGAGDGKPDPYTTLKQSAQIGEQKECVYRMPCMRLQHRPAVMTARFEML